MKKSFSAADVALSAIAILVPPTLLGGGHLAWSALRPAPVAQTTAQAPAAPTLAAVAAVAPAPVAAPTALSSNLTGTAGPVTVSARMDRRAVHAGGDGLVHVELTLTGEDRPGERAPTDLVVVLDRSGSMSGEPLQNAKAATASIIGALHPQDRFALVTYDDTARVDIALGLADDASRSLWLRQVSNISDGGSTNMSGGLDNGLAMLQEANGARGQRLILISDGMPNAGDPSPTGLANRARLAAARNIPLTAVGVGLNFDETLMRTLADAGAGNYHYVAQSAGLASVFEAELNQATSTVASGLTVTVPRQAGVTLLSASGYPLAQGPGGDSFNVGSLGGGQTRSLWLTYRVDTSQTGQEIDLSAISVAFEADGERLATMVPGRRAVAVVSDEAAALASIDANAWSEAVLTEEYNALRQQVADAVKAGDKRQAASMIERYRVEKESANKVVGSASVAQNLGELLGLQRQVEDAFTGADQQQKQNVMSKGVGSSAYQSRRKGQVDGW